jgi:hypothetical protein
MNRLELLANEIASLSNTSLERLAFILAEDYNPRATVLEQQLNHAMFDNDVAQRLGVIHG